MMPFNGSPEYIVEDTVLKRFYISGNTLYIEIIDKVTLKKDTRIIHKNITIFTLNKDLNGIIHIMAIDTLGKLIHIFNNGESWKKNKIENINFSSNLIKDLRLYININDNFDAHLIMLVNNKYNNNLWKIMHFCINSKNWSSQKISDIFIDRYGISIKTDIDKKGNIHLLYKSREENQYTLFYRKYDIKHKKWNPIERISKDIEISNLGILCDTNNYINIIWSHLQDKNIALNYLKKQNNTSSFLNWKKSKTIPTSISNFTNPILVQNNNHINLFWKRNDKLYSTQTKLSEDNWSNIKTINQTINSELFPLIYIGSKYKDLPLVHVPFTYYFNDMQNHEPYIVGLGQLNEIDNLPKKRLKSLNNTGCEFNNYIDEIKIYFQNNLIAENLISETKAIPNNSIESNLTSIQNFLNNLIYIYSEIENLKNAELSLLNSLTRIQNNHAKLYEKLKKLLVDYEQLNKHTNSKK
jgi:hypothetical protein